MIGLEKSTIESPFKFFYWMFEEGNYEYYVEYLKPYEEIFIRIEDDKFFYYGLDDCR